MSETGGAAPAAPTPAAAPAAPAPTSTSTPAPASQPGISISDAARLLRQQRANGEAPPERAPPVRTPSPSEQARQAAQKAVEAPQAAPAPKPAETGLSAMERALGVPGMVPPEGAQPSASIPTPSDGFEIDGRRYTPTELREHVLKGQDYTQKTQALAQERQQLQAQQQALASVLPYIQPELQRLAATLQQAEQAQRPDPSLSLTDPTAYVQQHAQWEAAVAEQQRLGQLTVMQQQAHERAMAQQVAQANEALAAEYPWWADPAQRREAQDQLVDWATNQGGFTRDELRGLADARHLKMMMKARAYDRMMEGARSSAPAPQFAAPPRGAPPPPPPTVRVQEAQAAFDAKPDWRRGAALLGAMRANGQAR